MFSTIITKDGKTMYHGYILHWINNNTWVFAFRLSGKNYEWKCDGDYWDLVI